MIEEPQAESQGRASGIPRLGTAWPLLGATGVFVIVAAILAPGRTATGLRFEPATYRFEEPVDGGSTSVFSVTIRNDSTVRLDLIGAASYCGSQGCGSALGLPKGIEPGTSEEVEIEFRAPGSGEFAYEITFYSNSQDEPNLPFTISGTALRRDEVEGSTDDAEG